MRPLFILSETYTPRLMVLVLSPEPGGYWGFYGRHHESKVAVPARDPDTRKPLPSFKTKDAAREFADVADLPAFGVWNGRRKTYEGLAYERLSEGF